MLNQINILLLVEDDENDVLISKRRISRSTIQVKELVTTATVEETKKLLQNKEVDVILLDLNLPDSMGLNTVDAIRNVYNGPIIVLTSIDDELVGIEAIRRGADEYLVKSNLTERLLSDAIYHAIERNKRWAHVAKVTETLSLLDKIGKEIRS